MCICGCSCELVQEWITLVNAVRKRIVPTQHARNKKAADVQILVDAFIPKLLALTETSGCTYYMHAMQHHLADMIRRLPVDIMDGSGEGLERKNRSNKHWMQ